MRIVNPATGKIISVEYTDVETARRAAHAMADDMGLNLEIHSDEGVERIEAKDWEG